MKNEKPIDLGDLGMSMAFFGMMTAVASFIIAFIAEAIISVAINTESSDLRYFSMAVVVLLAFNTKFFIRLIRLKASGIPVENKKNKVRIFESVVMVFMWAYELFYQYFPFEGNAEPEALDKFFGGIIIILAFYRLLTLSMFILVSKSIDWAIFAFMILTISMKVIMT